VRELFLVNPLSPSLTAADRAVLDRFYAGVASEAERAHVEALLTRVPVESRFAHGLSAAVRGLVDTPAESTRHAAIAALQAALQQEIAALDAANARSAVRSVPYSRHVWRVLSGAFVAVALIGLGLYWSAHPRGHAVPVRTYATGVGQRATIELQDGSRIMLAPQSRLSVPVDFGAATRTVALRGEGYFSVRSTQGTPFIVNTGPAALRVLGTSFDVRRYERESHVHVAVTSGRVRVVPTTTRQSVVLAAGTSGDFTDSSVVTNTYIDSTVVTDWSRGLLIFTHARVSVVFESLARWYGYEFHLADSALARKYVTATFMVDDRTQTMSLLQNLLNVRLTVKDSVVTLSPLRDTPMLPAGLTKQRGKDGLTPAFHSEVGR